jgi:hypothetical protein
VDGQIDVVNDCWAVFLVGKRNILECHQGLAAVWLDGWLKGERWIIGRESNHGGSWHFYLPVIYYLHQAIRRTVVGDFALLHEEHRSG